MKAYLNAHDGSMMASKIISMNILPMVGFVYQLFFFPDLLLILFFSHFLQLIQEPQ